MKELKKVFAEKTTTNGDVAYNIVGDNLVNILFMSQYYRRHTNEVKIGNSDKEKLFSMFIRDPRYGLGERDLGRRLMGLSDVDFDNVLSCGRADDLLHMSEDSLYKFIELLKDGNYYAKKWSPRLTSGKKSRELAKKIIKIMKINEKQYRKLIKCDTTEHRVCHKLDIDFSKVPSLAFLKHKETFKKQYSKEFEKFMEEVKSGTKKINISVTTPYDILKKCTDIEYWSSGVKVNDEADILFNALQKVNLGSILPIIDNSASMYDSFDSQGKAKAIGHYVAKNNTYMPNHVITFSSEPKLLELGNTYQEDMKVLCSYDDASNTNFGKVMDILSKLKDDVPEYLLVLSDMEFDCGSSTSKDRTMQMFKERSFNTKIIWWNFNAYATTSPEMDDSGNIFISGYNPQLLKFLESGFNAKKFLDKLLEEYEKAIANK